MIYVCSDVHGEYDLFFKLLKKINFSATDEMYVCGDMIEKGESSVKLVRFLMAQNNVHCIAGNHEYAFLKHYHSLTQQENVDFDKTLESLKAYFPNERDSLDWDVIDWIENLPYYIEREDFICAHAGVPLDREGNVLPLAEATREQLVYDRRFKEPSILPKTQKCIFFGHTPTTYIAKQPKIIGYVNRNFEGARGVKKFCKIHLDTGSWLNKVMGCFCVDNSSAYYVNE